MKKNIVYIAILAVGILLGYLFFGGSTTEEKIMDMHDHETNIQEGQLWTCSMHLQIMQQEPGQCPLCGMDLIPASTGSEGLALNQFKMSENALALANIQTLVIGDTNAQSGNGIKLSGKITTNEEANTTQTAHFDGRIEKLYINVTGETVRRGALLALIYSPELVAAQQELLTAIDLKHTQPELYDAVKNKLKRWKLSEKQINQIETSGKIKENFPIYANVSGVVTEKMVEEGNYVKQGQPLYKISNLSTVWAQFDVYESQISLLKKGQKIKVITNAFPDEHFDARINFIDPSLNAMTRTLSVRANLQNRNSKLKPGMFIEASVEGVSNISDVTILVPKTAVLWTGKRSLVYIKPSKEIPVFEMREVSLGDVVGEYYKITEGLELGEEIVVNGTFTVDAAAQLQGKKSMMNGQGVRTMTGHEEHLGVKETSNNHNIAFRVNFEKEFMSIFTSYIALKDALVATNAANAQSQAKKGHSLLQKIKLSNLNEQENEHIGIVNKKLKGISINKDIVAQRDHFKPLSKSMEAIISRFKNTGATIYVQFCPMADSNKGASWLSLDRDIINPFFGNQMLSCGEITKTIN